MKYPTIIIIIVAVVFSSCHPIKKIQKERGFSNECFEAYKYFKSHFERNEEGLFEFSNYNNDSTELKKVKNNLVQYYENNMDCWMNTLHKDDVEKIWGKPHRTVESSRTMQTKYFYYINTKYCTGLRDLAKAGSKCGRLGFFFPSESNKCNGGVFSIIESHGSLE